MAERTLSKFQYGLEATRGTPVAATRILGADIKGVPMDRTWESIAYANGRRSNANFKRSDQLLVRDTLSISNGYFQAVPVLGQCSLDGTITPVEQTGAQGDYLWAIAPSFTALNDPDTLTLEMGDEVQEYEVEYVMFDRLRFAGEIAQDGGSSPVAIEAGYFGRQVTPATFTAGQALHTGLTPINAKLARLYKDATWAGAGTTELTNLMRGFEVEILTGTHPKFMASADKYFTTHGESQITAMITLTLEGAAAADTIYDEYQAGTERALRLQLNGPQIGTGLTYRVRFDVFGYWAEVVPLNAESNLNNLHRALFVSKDDTVGPNIFTMDVITNNNLV